MKKLSYILFALFAIIMASCETHSSNNGDLDNWWYLRQVDDLTEGTTTDYVSKKVFWSYIGALMQTQGASAGTYLYRFEHKGNTLRVYSPRKNNSKSSETSEEGTTIGVKNDPLVEEKDLYKLEKHGLHMKQKKDAEGNPVYDSEGNIIFEETFTVEKLSSDLMVLVNEDNTLRLHFMAW